MKRKPDRPVPPRRTSPEDAERIALDALVWIVGDEGRVSRFLDATGLDPGSIRQAAGDPGFLAGVLDHLVADEEALLACAESLDLPPEAITGAWAALAPREFED
jgi:hypothetical protein